MMARTFDSDDIDRGAGTTVLTFTENVTCPECVTSFEGHFADDSMTVQDITDPPTGRHTCPRCGTRWTSEMTGWHLYLEGG